MDDIVAFFDQTGAAMIELAKVLHGFYKALMKEGFTEEQAMELTHTSLHSFLKQKGDSSL